MSDQEPILTGGPPSPRLAFWRAVAELREARQERLVQMLRPHFISISLGKCPILARRYNFANAYPNTITNFYRTISAGYEAASEKLLDVDFRP